MSLAMPGVVDPAAKNGWTDELSTAVASCRRYQRCTKSMSGDADTLRVFRRQFLITLAR
jgi:hypothetical protein